MQEGAWSWFLIMGEQGAYKILASVNRWREDAEMPEGIECRARLEATRWAASAGGVASPMP